MSRDDLEIVAALAAVTFVLGVLLGFVGGIIVAMYLPMFKIFELIE